MGNRAQRPVAITGVDMARLADGRLATVELEDWLVRLGYKPVVTLEDVMRFGDNVWRVRGALMVVEKYLLLILMEQQEVLYPRQ